PPGAPGARVDARGTRTAPVRGRRRGAQQRDRGPRPRPAQEIESATDPERARRRLHDARGRLNSLRAKLTVALLAVTALVGLLATAALYANARQEIEELFDFELRAVAESIDPRDLSRHQARAVGRLPDDDVLVQAWSPAGALVYRSDGG